MSENWINALDWCAASGVIDYDAPAFLLDQNPRYVGHPEMAEIPLHNDALLPKGTKLKSNPDNDVFENSDGNLVQNPTWKKVLFGTVITTAIAGAGYALLSKAKIIPKFNFSKLKTGSIGGFFSKIGGFVKKPFAYIAKKFKKAKP